MLYRSNAPSLLLEGCKRTVHGMELQAGGVAVGHACIREPAGAATATAYAHVALQVPSRLLALAQVSAGISLARSCRRPGALALLLSV
eukprot:768426-Hanusia_phi.AAC.2